MARKAKHVGVCGLSWLDFECVYRLVWLSFGLFGSVGLRGKSDKKCRRGFGFSRVFGFFTRPAFSAGGKESIAACGGG